MITNNISLQHMANKWGSEMMISMSHQTALPKWCFHLLPTNHCTHLGYMLLTCCCNLLENTNVQCKLQYGTNGSIVDSHPVVDVPEPNDGCAS